MSTIFYSLSEYLENPFELYKLELYSDSGNFGFYSHFEERDETFSCDWFEGMTDDETEETFFRCDFCVHYLTRKEFYRLFDYNKKNYK